MRYLNFKIEAIGTDKLPDMVIITKGPSKFKDVLGRRFINLNAAKSIIEYVHSANLCSTVDPYDTDKYNEKIMQD
jgi:hypothetical protein